MAVRSRLKPYGAALVAVRALREVIERELAAGLTLIEIHEKYREQLPVSYERFRIHVSREITGTAGSRGGRVTGTPPSQHKAPALDQPVAVPLSNLRPSLSPEKREQPNDNPSQTRHEPKRIVARVPDVDWLVQGIRRKPKE